MAVHDHDRRTARDYIHDARSRYDNVGSSAKWVVFYSGLAVLALIAYMTLATPNNDTTSEAIRQTPQNPTTTTNPQTTSPPSNTTTTAPSTK